MACRKYCGLKSDNWRKNLIKKREWIHITKHPFWSFFSRIPSACQRTHLVIIVQLIRMRAPWKEPNSLGPCRTLDPCLRPKLFGNSVLKKESSLAFISVRNTLLETMSPASEVCQTENRNPIRIRRTHIQVAANRRPCVAWSLAQTAVKNINFNFHFLPHGILLTELACCKEEEFYFDLMQQRMTMKC